MSLKLGTQDIAGISQNTKYNAHHLLDFKWTDCIINDVSWLRADTFSWQSGDVYTSAYNHLVQDIQGITSETETIGSYTITFYRGTDGHKVVLADQETTVANIYSETGIAWYYILDTTNTQFKLPRTKFGFEGLRTNVGDNIDAGLPNITGHFVADAIEVFSDYPIDGCMTYSLIRNYNLTPGGAGNEVMYYTMDASRSSSIYGNSSTVQEKATQMYLYFYVGDFSQTATEQTAGLNSELFNGKADVDLSNVPTSKGILTESYINGSSWYRVYSDGWCEQGGYQNSTSGISGVTINLLKPFINTNYNIVATVEVEFGYLVTIQNKTTSSFLWRSCNFDGSGYDRTGNWQACGYIS